MKEKSNKISVIVPVYNVAKYLKRCIDSIINQSYSNLEIILINDGSTDNSLSICYEYKNKDSRIRVVDQENMGLSGARNTGIEIATGKYLSFIDSDDYINIDFYKKLLNAIELENAEIAVCRYKRFRHENEVLKRIVTDNIVFYSGIEAIEKLLKRDERITNHAWNKLYRAELFDNIRYPVGKKFEDIGTTYLLFEKSKKVCYIDNELYYYYIRENSIVGNLKIDGILDKIELAEKRNAYLEDKYPSMKPLIKQYYLYVCTINTIDAYRISNKNILENDLINNKIKYIKEYIKKYGYINLIKNFEKNIVIYAIGIKANKKIVFWMCHRKKRKNNVKSFKKNY